MRDYLITTSYDKTIRILDQRLELKAEREYSNILTKICPISDDVYAIGQSKELLIEDFKFDRQGLKVESLMKLRGHAEKINDIGCLNSRIVGSSSSEGVKIWDLYKEKCEYTLKDDANPTAIDFIPEANMLIVAYNSHFVKLYSIETMKLIKKYELKGVPLHLDRGKFTEHQFYVGGFPSLLGIVDTRLSKLASEFTLKQGAIVCTTDSIYDQCALATGDRDGSCNIFDLRTKKSRIAWQAHDAKTSISKPRGVVKIFENSGISWTTVGCNDKNLKLWDVENVQKEY
jgi:WD40 repeat protein